MDGESDDAIPFGEQRVSSGGLRAPRRPGRWLAVVVAVAAVAVAIGLVARRDGGDGPAAVLRAFGTEAPVPDSIDDRPFRQWTWRPDGEAVDVVALGGTVAVLVDTGNSTELVGIDGDDGTERWTVELGPGRPLRALVVEGSIVAFATDGDTASRAVAVLEDGTVVWDRAVDGEPFQFVTTPDGDLVLRSYGGEVMVIDRQTGRERWDRTGLLVGVTEEGVVLATRAGVVMVDAHEDRDLVTVPREELPEDGRGTIGGWAIVGDVLFVGAPGPSIERFSMLDGRALGTVELDADLDPAEPVALSPAVAQPNYVRFVVGDRTSQFLVAGDGEMVTELAARPTFTVDSPDGARVITYDNTEAGDLELAVHDARTGDDRAEATFASERLFASELEIEDVPIAADALYLRASHHIVAVGLDDLVPRWSIDVPGTIGRAWALDGALVVEADGELVLHR